MIDISSFGNYFKTQSIIQNDNLNNSGEYSLLPIGNLKSYGDSCLNDKNILLSSKYCDNILDFDPDLGHLTVQAGITLDEILKFIVPKGFFLAVVPGTKFITIGGAIANDIHGKNHHIHGTFGESVISFDLLRSDIGKITCTPQINIDLFKATIGGLGLTGLITKATIQCIPIKSSNIIQKTIPFKTIDDFVQLSQENIHATYSVAWLDCVHGERGILMLGEFDKNSNELILHQEPKLSFFIPATFNFISYPFIKCFNTIFYHKSKNQTHLTHYDPYFFPLDGVNNWNRAYGKKGFTQFQCVLPNISGIKRLLKIIKKNKTGSFLTVLKFFSKRDNPGLLSFPQEGITLAIDFPINDNIKNLLKLLEEIVCQENGRIYPAKDSFMSGSSFRQFYPKHNIFSKSIDPMFSSSFWRRML